MSSTVPAVLTALFTMAQNAADTDVQVILGEPLVQFLPPKYLCLGWHAQHPGVITTQSREDLAGDEDFEVFDVYGQATSWRGDAAELPDAIPEAFAIADPFELAIRNDPTLGDLVQSAEWLGGDVELPQTTKGPVAAVLFAIHIEAWRQ
jgi:hypothetical protein